MNQSSHALYRKGQIQVMCAALLWSSGGLLLRLIQADEWTVIFWRSVFAIAFLLLIVVIREPNTIRHSFRQLGWPGVIVAVCLATDTVLFVLALNRTSIANGLIMLATAPFWAALLAWLVLREHIPKRTWFAMIASIVGIVVMVSGSVGSTSLIGDGMALSIAILFAVPVVIIRKHPEIRMMPAVILAAAMAATFAFPFATLWDNTAIDLSYIAFFGIVEYGVASVIFMAGARHIPAAQATLIGLMETVLGPIWVWLIIGEFPGLRTVAGGSIVLIALAIYVYRDLKFTQQQPSR